MEITIECKLSKGDRVKMRGESNVMGSVFDARARHVFDGGSEAFLMEYYIKWDKPNARWSDWYSFRELID